MWIFAFLAVFFLQVSWQVFQVGHNIAPSFLLSYFVFLSMYRGASFAAWCAFVAGLLWDLRWSNIVGVSSLTWSVSAFITAALWSNIPLQGRSVWLASGVVSGGVIGGVATNYFIWWYLDLLVAPAVLLYSQIIVTIFLTLGFLFPLWYLTNLRESGRRPLGNT